MKLAILGDLHLGCRAGSQRFSSYFEKFFSEVFFPELEKQGVKKILQLGDLFDTRKQILFQPLKEARRYLFDRIRDADLKMYTLLGNHDVQFRDTLEVSSTLLLLDGYADHIIPISEPYDLYLDNTSMLLIPWICNGNRDDIMKAIASTKSPLMAGHLELAGFEMQRGQLMKEGMDADLLSKFDVVFSGHYHHRSQKKNVLYCGVPYELTWMDYADPKGFYILDTETEELTFIENPFVMYKKIDYTDDLLDTTDFNQYASCYVRLIAPAKRNQFKFEKFIDSIQSVSPADLKIVESQDVEVTEELKDEGVTDTIALLDWYVEGVDTDIDKEELSTFLKQLYAEALTINE